MMTTARSWFRENQTLVYFLVAQTVALGAAGLSVTAYMVRLETRVHTMETRGAEYTVARIGLLEQRITVLEQTIKKNEATIIRLVDVMTKNLNVNPSSLK